VKQRPQENSKPEIRNKSKMIKNQKIPNQVVSDFEIRMLI